MESCSVRNGKIENMHVVGNCRDETDKNVRNYVKRLPRADINLGGAGIGGTAMIGYFIGMGVGSIGGPPGSLIGIAVGSAIGALVGFFIVMGVAWRDYENWREKYDGKPEGNELSEKLFEPPEIDEFVDPNTMCIFKQPVRDKYGTVHEFESISEWVKKKGEDYMRRELSVKDLTPAYDMMGKMAVAYVKLFQEEVQKNEMGKEALHGFRLYVKGLKEVAKGAYPKAVKGINIQLGKKVITREEWQEKIDQLNKDFGKK